jgi:LPPG:FO 2-phospho-L-lactate transferase
MKITVISGGVGGARFLRGVRAHVREAFPDGAGGSTASITAVVNTGDDMWLSGLRIAPDLDSIMYTLAGESAKANA